MLQRADRHRPRTEQFRGEQPDDLVDETHLKECGGKDRTTFEENVLHAAFGETLATSLRTPEGPQ